MVLPSGRSQPPIGPTVGPGLGCDGHDMVALGDEVVNLDVVVGERLPHLRQKLRQILTLAWRRSREHQDEIGSHVVFNLLGTRAVDDVLYE